MDCFAGTSGQKKRCGGGVIADENEIENENERIDLGSACTIHFFSLVARTLVVIVVFRAISDVPIHGRIRSSSPRSGASTVS